MAAILIVSRNNLSLTKAAVRTALKQNVPCEVLVIDNASTDGTVEWLKSKVGIHTGYFTTQRSLAACWNFGLKLLFSHGHYTVLTINNDVELRPDTYIALHTVCCLEAYGMVTGVSVDSREKFLESDDAVYDRMLENRTRPHPDMSCFMMKKSTIDKVGWFDEAYFPAFCEDLDYHVRMHRRGVKAVCVDLPVYHVRSQTLKQADKGERARIMRGADESRERFRSVYGCLPGSKEYEELFV